VHPFEWIVLVLALLVVPTVLLEESAPPAPWPTVAVVANWLIWLGFAAELAYVLRVAARKGAALRAHWLDVLIVLVTTPFAPALLASLRLLRLTRLLRLIRLARLALVGGRALQAARVLFSPHGFRYVALLTGSLVVIAGFGISVADTERFPNPGLGIWWAVTTVTTVGYGDTVPTSVPGRVLASALMLVGIGFLSLLTATIAFSFVARDVEEEGQTGHAELGELARSTRASERPELMPTGSEAPVEPGWTLV
jgi:voltage-gated potassium channel